MSCDKYWGVKPLGLQVPYSSRSYSYSCVPVEKEKLFAIFFNCCQDHSSLPFQLQENREQKPILRCLFKSYPATAWSKVLRPQWQLSLTPTNLLWAGALAQFFSPPLAQTMEVFLILLGHAFKCQNCDSLKRASLGGGGGGVQEGRKWAWKRLPVYPQLGKKIDTTEYTHPGSIIFAGTVLAWLCPLPLKAKCIPAASVFTWGEFTREGNAVPGAWMLAVCEQTRAPGAPATVPRHWPPATPGRSFSSRQLAKWWHH